LQTPLLQATLTGQAVPAAPWATHDPAALQKLVPVHESGSCVLVTFTHAPVPGEQLVHALALLHEDDAQQMPSLHVPVAQSVFAVHVEPGAPGT
jgi:hypothetical protein